MRICEISAQFENNEMRALYKLGHRGGWYKVYFKIMLQLPKWASSKCIVQHLEIWN